MPEALLATSTNGEREITPMGAKSLFSSYGSLRLSTIGSITMALEAPASSV